MDKNHRSRPVYTAQKSSLTNSPMTPSSPMISPMIRHHARTGSSNMKKAQTKAAAQKLAAVMSHQSGDEDEEEEDLDLDYSIGGKGSIGLSGGRPTRSRSPMPKAIPSRRPLVTVPKQDDEHNEDQDLPYGHSGTSSAGLTGLRPMQPRSPMVIGQLTNVKTKSTPPSRSHVTAQQLDDEDNDEDDNLSNDNNSGSCPPSIGLSSGRAVGSRNSTNKTAHPRRPQTTAPQLEDEDDELICDYSTRSNTSSIGLSGGRKLMPRSSTSIRTNQEQPLSARSTPGPQSESANSVQQPPSGSSTSADRASLLTSSTEQPTSARSMVTNRSPITTNSMEQHPYARSTTAGRPMKAVHMMPAAVPISLKPVSPMLHSDSPTYSWRGQRMSTDFGTMTNSKEDGNQNSALQDELDMLQEENESLLEKLRLAEEKGEEADARAQQLEKQVASLGEGTTLEARLISKKEAALQQREAALRVAAQNHGGRSEEISSLLTEAEIARDEASSAFEQLHEIESEYKSLRTMTLRMILTEEEMEEVVLKRCWLARYWGLCVQHGIQTEISGAKYDYWSSFAPLPFEIVLSAGQRAQEEDYSEATEDLEERDKVLRQLHEISGEGNAESMLLVERGLRELVSLKVEEAVAFSMARDRCRNALKEKVKQQAEGHVEVFELSEDESEDVRFKQAWLIYFWGRAKNHEIESDIADERLQYWINHSQRASTSHDAMDVERGLIELKKLSIETQIWQRSRKGLEHVSNPKVNVEFAF